MANRFPLIVNPDTKEIQEISQNDNLDLTGNGIYAGGSLGQNGQVLTTNGTSVEWRTVTGGGGGGGGIDSDTTYIIEAEDQADGASLNLVAGGSGIGTIRIKFQDSGQLQFDTTDNLTIAPTIKAGSIENSQLLNNKFTFRINGVDTDYPLGSTVTIPQYGDVYATATQNISNKTFTDCTMSLAPSTGNSIVSIPNSSLINKGLNINGNFYELGDSVTIVGGGGSDTNTTYTLSAIDWSEEGVDNPNKKAIRLLGSDSSTSGPVLVAGDRMSISRSGDEITLNATEINTDTDTTYSINTDTYLTGNLESGARLNLSGGGTGVGNATTDRVNLVNGTGVTVNSVSDDSISFNIGQDVSTSSNVQFNSLTLTGSLTVEGATTFVDTTNLVITDKTITIGDGTTNSELANGAGILIGTSNINFVYNHSSSAWRSTSNMDLVTTKSYKIGGTEVLSSTLVLGKAMPLGNIVGTVDTQTLSNKTIQSPVISEIINTGTLYLPAPAIADTLVGRATSDTLTNKTIDGDVNTLQNIGNSSLSNSYMIINGTQRNLGDSFTVTAAESYTDEKAQDTVAGMITSATHSGISWVYDDTAGTLAATVTAAGAEADTLDTVTGRGATTSNDITLNGATLNLSGATSNLYIGATSNRIEMSHNTSNGNLTCTTGYMYIRGASGFRVQKEGTGTDDIIKADADGAVELYYDDVKKFETTTNGAIITGALTAGGLTYPTTNGTSGEILTSDGAGNVTWGASTAPVAVGCINLNGSSPTWSGTTGYTVAHSGGGGSDEVYTLTFPSAYSARTDYIVNVTYDGYDWVGANGAQVGVERGTTSVVFVVRRWNEDPLNLGDLMVTVYDL